MRFATHFSSIVAAGLVAIASPLLPSQALAATFGQQEVNQGRFIAIAAPREGGASHQLLILEQISDARPCWQENTGQYPITVEPLLVNFDFTGICGRSRDSNGYSIRINGEDFGLNYNLRIVRKNNDLFLIGSTGVRDENPIEIARAYGDTNSFARLFLGRGWRFTRRTVDGSPTGHIYLTYEGPTPPPTLTDVTPPIYAFGDIYGDTYADEISEAVDIGFIAGYPEDNTFRPTQPLTREQLVSMVISALDSLSGVNLTVPTQANGNPYTDVEASRWSAAKIQFAKTNNIVSGYQDGSFRPAQPVTRAELMAVLRRAAEYARTLKGQSATLPNTQAPTNFSDTSTHWANELISQMSAYCGVASPLNEAGTSFAPNEAALRNYAAAATLRTLRCLELPASAQPSTPQPTQPQISPSPLTQPQPTQPQPTPSPLPFPSPQPQLNTPPPSQPQPQPQG